MSEFSADKAMALAEQCEAFREPTGGSPHVALLGVRAALPAIAAQLRAARDEVEFWKDLHETSLERLTDIKRDYDGAVSRAAISEAENTHSFLRMLKLRDDAVAERDSLRIRLATLEAALEEACSLAVHLNVNRPGYSQVYADQIDALRAIRGDK